MMMVGRVLTLMLCMMVVQAPIAVAHPPAIINQAAEQVVGEEVTEFRKALADAIRAKDAAKLKQMYHPGFAHTHPTGKSDARDAHLAAVLAGETLIETVDATDLNVRVPNDWVAIVQGTGQLKSKPEGRTYAVRWMQVFTRTEKSWILVASQATRLRENK